ncbi:replication protein A 32 kDa subunit A-like [Impatiens glandulifera]|uniref:replication protein A 32 kDa subunit A-like n=1 Tax=Impatiens glandulifera TaxID=253017 RepID=UPI001FB0CECD|nr:replication protein A 32 kDa subunit A-like [Impatiens glandulifera]
MMFSTQFDSMSQSSQFPDYSSSPAKTRETYGLVPVTLKQISEASQSGDDKSNFLVDGAEISNITVIGMLSSKTQRVTDVSFALDDGTARIHCNRWVNENFDTKEMEDVEDDMYVRVNGRLKNIQGRKQLVAYSVRPVTNFDEVTFHFIECIHYHMRSSKLQFPGNGTSQTPLKESSAQEGVVGSQSVQTNYVSGQFNVDGLKAFDQMVLEYLQQPANFERERGVHTDELLQKLKIPMEKIMESIRTLEEEGLIYSTIDEFHFKSTSN